MKRFRGHCTCRPEISLLAAGVLDEAQKEGLERHLSSCPECRSYHAEVRSLAATMANWDKDLSAIEATSATRNRWRKALQEFAAPAKHPSLMEIAWRELILPSRYLWAGLAAIWVAMLIIHVQIATGPTPRLNASAAVSPQEIREAWQYQNRVLAELTRGARVVPTPQPVPGPRSQKKSERRIV